MKLSPRVLFILSIVVALASMMFRRPDALFASQFWAEEGAVFYAEAYRDGWSSLFNPCAGYFHLYPRLLSCTAVTFGIPLHIVPFLFCYGWLLMLFCVLIYIWKRLEFSPLQLFFISVAVVLIPIQSEVFMNLTNVQWIMALFPIIILSSKKIRTQTESACDIFFMLLAGFTGPNFTLLVPAVVVICIIKRNEILRDQRKWLVAIWAVAAGAGALSLLTAGSVTRMEGTFHLLNQSFIAVVFMQYAFLFIGKLASYVPVFLQVIGICGFIFAGFIAFRKIRQKTDNTFEWLCLITGIVYLAASLISYRNNPAALSPWYGAPRNFYIPALTCVWLIIRLLESNKYALQITTAMLILFAIETVTMIGPLRYEQIDIRAYDEQIQNSDSVSVPINPKPWTMELIRKR